MKNLFYSLAILAAFAFLSSTAFAQSSCPDVYEVMGPRYTCELTTTSFAAKSATVAGQTITPTVANVFGGAGTGTVVNVVNTSDGTFTTTTFDVVWSAMAGSGETFAITVTADNGSCSDSEVKYFRVYSSAMSFCP